VCAALVVHAPAVSIILTIVSRVYILLLLLLLQVYETLTPLVWSSDTLFAYSYSPTAPLTSGEYDWGWELYADNGVVCSHACNHLHVHSHLIALIHLLLVQIAEFGRMGIPNDVWSLSDVNRDYKLVPTYPSMLVLPAQLAHSVVYGSAEFRTKSRLPALCWKHPQVCTDYAS